VSKSFVQRLVMDLKSTTHRRVRWRVHRRVR
jgi:hypothetical protein